MANAKEKLIAGAQKLVEKGAYEKAIKEYLRVVQEDDSDVRIWLKIGDLYAKIGKKQEATETYQRVAQFYSDQGFYLKSVAVYKQILKLEPRLVDVNQRLAELYKQLGLISDAIHQYEQVAGFYHKEGRVREALGAMKQIVELDPETVAARIKLAEMYSRENMPREAIEEFTKAAEQLKEQGRTDEYMKVAERLLFHSPDNRPVTKELARLYIEKNDPRRALPKLQVLFKADPRDLDVLRLLARAFEGLEQRPKAVSVYKELARILNETGDTRGAAEVFQQILVIEPDDADAQAALKGRRPGSGVSRSSPAAPAPSTRRPTPPPPPPSGQQRSIPSTSGQRSLNSGSARALDSGGGMPVVQDRPTIRPSQVSSRMEVGEPEGDDVVGEEIAKILSETDVYIKYNLHAKAIEHLQRVFERNPRHTAAREKLKALFITTGKKDEAILELWALAEAAEPGRARRYVREIYELEPNNARAAEILGEPLGGSRGPAVDDDPVDEFAVAAPTDFGLPSSTRRPEPATRRGRTIEPAIEEPSTLEAEDAMLEEISDLEPMGEPEPMLDVDAGIDVLTDDADDLIPVVIDSGSHRVVPVEETDDQDRFSLDDDPSVTSFEPVAPPPTYEVAEPDAETRFGGPNILQPPPKRAPAPAASRFDEGEDDGTAQMSADEFASFDDPSVAPAPKSNPRQAAQKTGQMKPVAAAVIDDGIDLSAAEELPAVTAEAPQIDSIELDPPSGTGRRPAPAPIPDSGSSLEDDLDESDFFMQQNLLEEARSMLTSLLDRYPEHPLVQAKIRDLEQLEREAGVTDGPPLEPMPTDNALSAQLPTDLPGSGEIQSMKAETPSGEHVEVTRRGVIERGVSAEDFETHYDLGIAYKEMGLIDDAIAEFRIVMKETAREVQCLLMIGLCHIERQQFTEAINQFKKGLYVEGITDAEALSLYFELGSAYEKVGDPREALYYYDKVQKRDPKFRDLPRRLRALRGEGEDPDPRQGGGQDLDAAFDSLLEET